MEEDWVGYSSISRLEVMGFPELTVEDELKISDILSIFHEVDIRKNVIDMAIRVRREKKIKVPDAIVASTALLNNAVLVTRNDSDFKGLKGLEVLNPFK